MSSETRKKAWRSSISQPSVAVGKNSEDEGDVIEGSERRSAAVSGTERPRLHLPPIVLWKSDFAC